MRIPACIKCGRTGFILTSFGGREYCDCPAGALSKGLRSGEAIEAEPKPRQVEDTVRVLRILEYTGPRSKVEELIAKSVHGERRLTNVHDPSRGVVIRAATIGNYPEVLGDGVDNADTDTDPLDDSGSLGQPI